MDDREGIGRFLNPLERFPAELFASGFAVVFLVAVFVGPWAALAAAGIVGLAQALLVRNAFTLRNRSKGSAAESSAQAVYLRGELNRAKSRMPYEDIETGLGSRRQLEVAWTRQAARHRRWGEPFSLAVFRVCGADSPGESLSVEQACVVAGVMLDISRAEDVVCRVDNDLFVALLAASGREGAVAFSSRVVSALEDRSHTIDDEEVELRVVSGVSEWQEGMTAAPQMVKLAMNDFVTDELERARAARSQQRAS